MQAVDASDVVLHAVDGGLADGWAVVFINSLGTDLRIWDDVAARLAGDFRLIRYDQRGHGLSGCPAGPWSIADHVRDLVAILDHFGVERAVLVGLSVGGMVALAAARDFPDRVGGLVLADTAHRIGSEEVWDTRIAAVTEGGIEAVADGVLERWLPAAFRSERAAEASLWRAMLTRTPPAGYVATCAAIRDADLADAARAVRAPTLCLCGSDDVVTPPALMAETAKLIAGARLETIAGSGHLPCIDNPDVFARRLTAYLQEI